MRNQLLERVSFGAFFTIFGVIWLSKDYYDFDIWAMALILAGVIMILLNLARAAWKVKVSTGSLGIGVVALLVGWAMLGNIELNWIALLLIVIGVWISLDAVAKRR